MKFDAKVDTAGLTRFRATLESFSGTFARVGILGKGGGRKDGKANADLGKIHEFGDSQRRPAIPERSFLRSPLMTHMQEAVDKKHGPLARALAAGDTVTFMALLGASGMRISKRAFGNANDGKWPPNAPYTIKMKKGRNRPLIDTGQLRRSIDFDVV
ncbi:MAG: hypothetical protein LBK99_20240 [Opitutaceae bacterium]|jgi:hypothetical protein|nr:hypothetical protein [Opitutaceae bacterium]